MPRLDLAIPFSPGEWSVQGDDLTIGGQIVGPVPAPSCAGPRERRANGKVIAAAPKMARLLAILTDPQGGMDEFRAALDEGRALLAGLTDPQGG